MQTIEARCVDQLMTLREVETMTRRKVATLRKDIRQRRIAHVKIGRSIRIPRSVIEELITSGWRGAVELTRDGH